MHSVYILHSTKLDALYIGETADLEKRLDWHNSGIFEGSHTKIANDWKVYFEIHCKDIIQARKIEKHIKAMKSKTYLLNLKKYPEISQRLLVKYS